MVLTKEKRDEKQRELEIKKYDFQNMQKKYQSEFRDLEAKYIDKLKKEIFELAKEIGQKEGYYAGDRTERRAVLSGIHRYHSKLVEAYNKKYPGDKAQSDSAE